jgi:hypothetical protein
MLDEKKLESTYRSISIVRFSMTRAGAIALTLIDEAIAARAHYQVWWALRNLAIPKYLSIMNVSTYVDFFHASNAGHYKLFLLALGKAFDRDTRVAGFSELRKSLRAEGRADVAREISRRLKLCEPHVKAILGIRSKSLVHNEQDMPRHKLYKLHGITPNQLRTVVDTVSNVMNYVAQELDIPNGVFEGDRLEKATLALLDALSGGAPNKSLEHARGR